MNVDVCRFFCVFLASYILTGCGPDRTINNLQNGEQALFDSFQAIAPQHQLHIAEENELGEKLYLCLTFIDKSSEQKLDQHYVYFYHTSSAGNYEQVDPNDETTARLSGNALTDREGRIFVTTILPGNYGSSDDNRHIHTSISGAVPEAYDIHFTQYATYMFKRFVNRSDQHFLAELKRLDSGELVTYLTIAAKFPDN